MFDSERVRPAFTVAVPLHNVAIAGHGTVHDPVTRHARCVAWAAGSRLYLYPSASGKEDNAPNQGQCASDGRQRYIMFLFTSSVDRPDVHDLL